MIFTRRLAAQGQTREFTVEQAAAGWIAMEGDGHAAIRKNHIRDWRQVEAMIALFERKASELRLEGWTEI